MARNSIVTCDWCETTVDDTDEAILLEHHWFTVDAYDIVTDEIVTRDFCCTECIAAYYEGA